MSDFSQIGQLGRKRIAQIKYDAEWVVQIGPDDHAEVGQRYLPDGEKDLDIRKHTSLPLVISLFTVIFSSYSTYLPVSVLIFYFSSHYLNTDTSFLGNTSA